ncbi:MAG: uroporphyrinogen-III decarboxylase-like protein [Anaerolineae bacterium]|nr:uroporphyrinogen-III decarboxylase-like protein [Anaerolineae bacterium]
MNQREVVLQVLRGQAPAYVPWHFSFTVEAAETLRRHYGTEHLDGVLGNHFAGFGSGVGFFTDLGNDHLRDGFGVVWDRSVDKDIGIVADAPLKQPSLHGYALPDPLDGRFFDGMAEGVRREQDRFRIFSIGFSLWERAWTLRGGIDRLMMDLYDAPEFVHELLDTICDYNITQAQHAMTYDIDAVYFGDDWGMQRGLQMGPKLWMEFIYPRLQRMYGAVKAQGKYVFIHSCGDVDELFERLIAIGLDCFNPFQPEVMDVATLVRQYRGRLAFHGGLSTQKTLPYGTADDVRAETHRLLELGRAGGFILSPAHAVEGDVPLENMLAFIEEAQAQR